MPTIVELKELYNTGKLGCGCGELLNGVARLWASDLCSAGARVFYFPDGRDDHCYARDYSVPNDYYNPRAFAVRSPK